MNAIRHRFAVLAASVFVLSGAVASASAADVVIVGSGGVVQDAFKKALWEPAGKKLGLTVADDTSQSWTDAKAQVDSGSVSWDIININIGECQLAADAGILVKLPADIVDRSKFSPGSVNDYCVGNTVFSQIMGVSTKKWGGDYPKNMVDFFDAKKFPGKRGLTRGPRGNIEAAAMALGKSHDEVYPFLSTEEGLTAAFAKLEELIKTSDVVWWDSGAQLTQLIVDGQVDLSYGWDGRIITAMDAGAPVKPVYQDGIIQSDGWAVLKGGPHTDNAIKFVKEISKAEYVKDLPKYVAYGGANLLAYDGYDEKTLSRLTSSPKNVDGQLPLGVEFWNENGAELSERFDTMLLSIKK